MKKLLIIGSVSAALIYAIVRIKKMADQFTFEIAGYGLPKIQGWIVTLPVRIKFFNPYPTPLPVQRFQADIFIKQGSTWQQVSRIDQPLTIAKGHSEQTIDTVIDLAATFSNVFKTLQSFILAGSLDIRTDVTVTVGNVSFKQDPFIQSIKVPG